jgi:hypothetical protein
LIFRYRYKYRTCTATHGRSNGIVLQATSTSTRNGTTGTYCKKRFEKFSRTKVFFIYGKIPGCTPVAITKDGAIVIANTIFRVNSNPELSQYQRVFSSLFGIKVVVVVLVWNKMVLHPHIGDSHKFVYLLWSLYFLKNYNTDDVMGTNSEVATNTMRKWI